MHASRGCATCCRRSRCTEPGELRPSQHFSFAPATGCFDICCGTGLNFPMLLEQVGPSGRVVGVDRSAQMLRAAGRKLGRWHADNVILVQADATRLPGDQVLAEAESGRGYDAVLFTYSLSLMSPWSAAWHSATALLRDGGRVAVVDMQLPAGAARVASPLASWRAPWAGPTSRRIRGERWSGRRPAWTAGACVAVTSRCGSARGARTAWGPEVRRDFFEPCVSLLTVRSLCDGKDPWQL